MQANSGKHGSISVPKWYWCHENNKRKLATTSIIISITLYKIEIIMSATRHGKGYTCFLKKNRHKLTEMKALKYQYQSGTGFIKTTSQKYLLSTHTSIQEKKTMHGDI